MIEELDRELEELKKKALRLKRLRDESNAKTKERLEERNDLNEQHSELIRQAGLEKKLRDEANKEVAENKEKKAKFRKQILELVERIRQFKEKKQGITAPNMPPYVLQQQIKDMEWRIQTTVLDTEKERELVSKISELEMALGEQKKHNDVDSRIIEASTNIEILKSTISLVKKEIVESARIAQEHHTKMIELYENAKRVKERADTVHQEFLETKNIANDYHQKYLELRKRMRELVQKIHEQKSFKRKEKRRHQEELLKEKTRRAYEKLKMGEKLTFDEFAMLLEQGLI
ncbi:MAG: coiled-coil protein [Promethearchaeota archaeon]